MNKAYASDERSGGRVLADIMASACGGNERPSVEALLHAVPTKICCTPAPGKDKRLVLKKRQG